MRFVSRILALALATSLAACAGGVSQSFARLETPSGGDGAGGPNGSNAGAIAAGGSGNAPFSVPLGSDPGSGAGGQHSTDGAGGSNGSGGTLAPSSGVLTCDQGSIVRPTGSTTGLTWTYTNAPNPTPPLSFTMRSEPATSNMGSLTAAGPLGVSYTAPATSNFDLTVTITGRAADLGVAGAHCIVHVPATGAIGVVDDGITRGLVGKVYPLAANTSALPTDLDSRKSVEQIVVGELDIPNRSFSLGFPDVPNLFEWFAIAFQGTIIIPSNGTYYFQVTSDDGANLYIDGYNAAHRVVNNDGTHAVQSANGSVALTAGRHPFRVDYFQGPRYYIALQVYWRTNTSAPWVLIPWTAFDRP